MSITTYIHCPDILFLCFCPLASFSVQINKKWTNICNIILLAITAFIAFSLTISIFPLLPSFFIIIFYEPFGIAARYSAFIPDPWHNGLSLALQFYYRSHKNIPSSHSHEIIEDTRSKHSVGVSHSNSLNTSKPRLPTTKLTVFALTLISNKLDIKK